MAAHRPEPRDVYPELLFEDELERLVRTVCDTAALPFVTYRHLGLDLAVFIAADSRPSVRMIEAKAYKAQRQGGVGFGNGRGEGPQVDLLVSEPSALRIVDRAVGWALADATMPIGTARYAFFDCSTARQAAMGGVARGKQNNLSLSALKPRMTTWDEFCGLVEAFVLQDRSP